MTAGGGGKGIDVEVTIDRGELARLYAKLGPDLYEKAIDRALVDATLLAEGVAKDATPVRTGHARRSTVSDTKRHEVHARYPYFNWLDQGRDSRGREIRSPRGGYQIRAAARDRVEAAAGQILDRAGREVAQRWASR